MENNKNILITGASGLVGGHVARCFAKSGNNIFCMVRKESDVSFISDLPVTIVYGDVTDREGLEKLFEGMDWIIHTAGRVADWGKYDDYYRTNVTGTMNVMEAASVNNIRDVIITGSVSSYGEENSPVLKDESWGFRSHYHYALDRIMPSGMNNYRDTKAEATRRAVEFAAKNGINLTVLEPVWIYGENEFSSGFYEYVTIARSGMPFMPGCKTNTFHVVYAAELARAYWLVFVKRPAGINRIIIGDPKPENMRYIYGLFCREAGVKQPRMIAKWLIYPIAVMIEAFGHLVNQKSAPLLMRSRVSMFYDSIGFSVEKAEKMLGFRSEVDLETGIRNTVAWYWQHGRL